MAQLSHFDETGASRMVDVGSKDVTEREAEAVGFVRMQPETLRLISDRQIAKGDVFEVARLAGIQGAKRTSELVPLCHLLPLDGVRVGLVPADDCTVKISARVRSHGRTGVEMEALTAVAVAALTVYDMCKAVDREMTIGPVGLVEKSGGKGGDFRRELRHEGQETQRA